MRDKVTEEDQKAIDEWLKKNEITKCEPFERTSSDDIAYTHGWGKKKKKKKDG
jgi:uncharacterized protein YggL (DUF469 family)